ncbi:MAG: VanZ family protein [Rubrivivax sp.]|jgi:VanZ family protein
MPAGRARQRHRSSASLLALAWATLVLYASLFPFTGWRWPPGQALDALLVLRWPPWLDVLDLWANGLGYLPLGLLLLVGLRRSGAHPGLALLGAVALPAGLSYVCEVAQNFLPGRHPSLKDLALNSLGAAVGALLGVALHRLHAIDRWQGLRQRWFVPQSAGALALLALWPVGLLFPAPVPLGLGQVGPRLREALADLLDGVPWAQAAQDLWQAPLVQGPRLPMAGEAAITLLGLLGPCLLAYTVVQPGLRRLVLALGALALGWTAMTLSTWLNFGPEHALAWLTPLTIPALLAATVLAGLLAPLGRRACVGLALVALASGASLVAQAPTDAYFAQSLQAWEQGRFVHFHGLAQWVGWLWPYAALGWLLLRLSARD